MRSCGIINEAISGAAEKKKHACAPDPSEDKSGRGEFRALKKVFASCSLISSNFSKKKYVLKVELAAPQRKKKCACVQDRSNVIQ